MNQLTIQILTILSLILIPLGLVLYFYSKSDGPYVTSNLYGLLATNYARKKRLFAGKIKIEYLKK